MKLSYEVHSVTEEDVVRTIQLDGQEVQAKIPGVTVELQGSGYCHTFRFTDQSDVAVAKEWVAGQSIEFDLGAVGEPPVRETPSEIEAPPPPPPEAPSVQESA